MLLGSIKFDGMLADEPTSSLDPKTSVEIMELLKSQGIDQQIPVLVNIHDVGLARRYADRIIGMNGGKVVFDDAPAALSDDVLNMIRWAAGRCSGILVRPAAPNAIRPVRVCLRWESVQHCFAAARILQSTRH